MPSFEVLLPIGAISLYLYDAMLLLYGNEIALVRRGGRWHGSLGAGFLIGRRRPYLPNPFLPGAQLVRARWDEIDIGAETGRLSVEEFEKRTRPLRVIVVVQAMLLLVVLPPVSIAMGAGTLLLATFAVFYLLSVVALGMLFVRRKALAVSPRACAVLVFESLLCAPFAINLVRKLSLARASEVCWLELAEQSMPREASQALAHSIGTRIDEYLAVEEPGSARATRLESLRARLLERINGAVTA